MNHLARWVHDPSFFAVVAVVSLASNSSQFLSEHGPMGGDKEKQEEMHLGVQVFTYGFGETNKTFVKMTDFQVSNERNPGCLGYI